MGGRLSDANGAQPDFSSKAEKDVWLALQDGLTSDDVVFTNLRLTDHEGDHEGDLIVGLAGAGIAVIEVKGGRVTHNGTDWIQHGGTSKRIDPVSQARKTKFALRSYLDKSAAWDGRRVRMTHLVAFPYSTIPRDLSLPECPRWMVLDKNDLKDQPLESVRQALTNQTSDLAIASTNDVASLVQSLSPVAVQVDRSSEHRRAGNRTRWLAAASAVLVAIFAGVWTYLAQTANGADAGPGLDPRFPTCLQAKAAGYGMYVKDRDSEYAWYRDLDHDGRVCE